MARAGDALLELGVLALAAWTVVYHVCLYLHVRVVWAAVAEVVAVLVCAWLWFRRRPEPAAAPPVAAGAPRSRRWPRGVLAACLVVATAAAVLFGWVTGAWTAVWILWLLAALGALAVLSAAPAEERVAGVSALEAAAVVVWSAGLAVLSLFVVNPDTDDSQYVHVSQWVAAHGRFPLRDVLFSDQALPSLFFPPVSSYEGLLGTLARGLPVSVADLVYLVVVPVAVVLAVLALWRLLRSWGVPLTGLALSVALVFLLFDAGQHFLPGSYFIGRIWQGKVVYVTILIPVAFSLLHEYARAPSRRALAMLGATGAAGVGLTTTAIFTLPVLAAACMAPLVRSRPRAALAGLVATAAYPLALGAVTLVVGGRNPDEYIPGEIVPDYLVHRALGVHVLGAIALFAVLAGALAVPRRSAGRMVAVAALALGVLYIHPITSLVHDATGLGRVLWRLMWIVPVAALVGTLAVRALPTRLPVALRAAPAVAVCVLMVLAGVPITSQRAGSALAGHPSLKLFDGQLRSARAILAQVPGRATLLAPQPTSQALLILSGRVTTVAPLDRYVKALEQFPGPGHYRAHRQLMHFAEAAVDPSGRPWSPQVIARDLTVLRVDLACVPRRLVADDALLARLGWRRGAPVPNLTCRRPPARPHRAA